MSFSVDSIFGIHAQALTLRSQRSELLASNLANADTPNFKAKDIDFRAALRKVQDQQSVTLTTTSTGHMRSSSSTGSGNIQYRTPNQASLDGNTVDAQVEQTRFAENALRYKATLRFLNGKIHGLMTAIRGE